MTIAAAFRCNDGIVVCADSQETINDYLKVSVPKIEIRPEGISTRRGLFAVFVGAGHAPLIDKLVDEMWDAAENATGGLRETAKAMAAASRNYYKELKGMFRDRDTEYPRAELIYAINLKEELALFKASGPIINRVKDYELAGIGDIIAKYISDRAVRTSGMTVNQAVILAMYVLNQTETYVEGCGGQHQIVVMKPGRKPEPYDNWKQVAATAQMPFLDIQSMNIILSTPDLDLSNGEFEKKLHHLMKGLRHSRSQLRKFREMLSKSIETMSTEMDEIDKKHPLQADSAGSKE